MSLLWVAKQPAPRLNNQQLPPVSACEGMRGAGALLGRRFEPRLCRDPHPARPPPRGPAGKAEIPPKAARKTMKRCPCALPGRRPPGRTEALPASREEEGREGMRCCSRRAPAALAWLPSLAAGAFLGGTATPRPSATPPCLSLSGRAMPRCPFGPCPVG